MNREYTFEPERFRGLQVPTLFLEGGDSPDWSRAAGEALQAALPDCRVGVMPGQRHAAMDTGTELFIAEVLSFLEARARRRKVGGHVRAGELEIWVEQVGAGPVVLPFQEVPDEWNARVDAFWPRGRALGWPDMRGRERGPPGHASKDDVIEAPGPDLSAATRPASYRPSRTAAIGG